MPFIIDEQNEQIEQGKWFDFRESKFLIASSASLKFMRTMTRMQKPFRRQIEKNQLDPADNQKILVNAMAESIVLDWKNVVGRDRVEVPYSREAAAKALKDPSFREFVMEISADLANFREEESEEEEKS